MPFGYDELKDFLSAYCRAYSQYAGAPDTIGQLHRFWAPDLTAVAFFRRGDNGDYPIVHDGRDAFQQAILANQSHFRDTMEPLDMVIDTISNKVAVMSKIVKTDIKTGEIVTIHGMGKYEIKPHSNGQPMIAAIHFFWDAPETVKKRSR